MINDFTQFGAATTDVTKAITYYYAGIDGRTLHIYKITREGLLRPRESERMPILLLLGNDDTAVFPIQTFSRGTAFTLCLKKNPDNSVTVTVPEQHTERVPQPRVVSSLEHAALLSRRETVVLPLPENLGNFGANQHIDQPTAADSLAGGQERCGRTHRRCRYVAGAR